MRKKRHGLCFATGQALAGICLPPSKTAGSNAYWSILSRSSGHSPDGQRWGKTPQIEHFKHLISDLRKRRNSQCSNVVFLWGIDAEPQCASLEDLEGAALFSCSSLAYLVNAFVNAEEIKSPRIWIVTQGAHALNKSEKPCLSQAPLWGMGRVLSAEHPDLWGGLIDLDPNFTTNDAVRNLLAQILSGNSEDQVSFRGAQRYAPFLSLCEKRSHPAISFSQKERT